MSDRGLYIAGNWKMNKSIAEATALTALLVQKMASVKHRIMIAPPYTALSALAEAVKGSNIGLGAQNMAQAESGAYTGEISPLMLREIGVATVIIGHSERRAIFGEADSVINTKVRLALKHEFEVILCVGETLEERNAGSAEAVVENQLKAGLEGVGEDELRSIVVAYEPVWAIGTGKTATPEDANDMHSCIRSNIEGWYSKESAQSLIIQYGGSVKPNNAKELLGQKEIDGALVGGASLDAESFLSIATAL